MASDDDLPDIPWEVGVFDAHCHPTDTLSSLQAIPGMRAKVLTVMATRAEDQDLVAQAAEDFGVSEDEAHDEHMNWSHEHKIIPAFGWHPWFSHQMYDETEHDDGGGGGHDARLTDARKIAHYQSVLTPRSDDPAFLLALPDPRPFAAFLADTRARLRRFPLALVGEIGLDRSFRIPEAWLPAQVADRDAARTPGGREGRRLSPYRVAVPHQRKVMLAQLRLAGEERRAVSVHGVQAHGIVYETLADAWKGFERAVPSRRERKRAEAEGRMGGVGEDGDEKGGSGEGGPKPFPPRVCLHSFSGPAETVKQYLHPSVPCEVFFSFSVTVNAWAEDGEGKVEAAVKAVPDDQILIESDIHMAGEQMDAHLAGVVRKICEVKGWEIGAGTRQLGTNWKRFVFGTTQLTKMEAKDSR